MVCPSYLPDIQHHSHTPTSRWNRRSGIVDHLSKDESSRRHVFKLFIIQKGNQIEQTTGNSSKKHCPYSMNGIFGNSHQSLWTETNILKWRQQLGRSFAARCGKNSGLTKISAKDFTRRCTHFTRGCTNSTHINLGFTVLALRKGGTNILDGRNPAPEKRLHGSKIQHFKKVNHVYW